MLIISFFFYLAHEASKSENKLHNAHNTKQHNGTKKQIEQEDAQKTINIKTIKPLVSSPTISPAAHGAVTSALNGTWTRTTEFHVEQSKPKNGLKTRAVIHMGVHKTGTMSIQHASRDYQQMLKKDGYEMSTVGFTDHWRIKLG